jgi:hypothetical protein
MLEAIFVEGMNVKNKRKKKSKGRKDKKLRKAQSREELDDAGPLGRVKDEKSQLGITAICFYGTILYGETEFTALLMF